MATRMQQRRGTASQWSGANPILNAGEIGWESDTNKFKIGDGTNHWADLAYFSDAASITAAINNLVDGAPQALDTLNEIAAALGDNANFLADLATESYVQGIVADNVPDFAAITGQGLTYDNGQIKLDNSYAGEVAMDAVAGAFNSGTGLQHNYDDVANTLTIDIDSTVATKEYADDAVGTHNSTTESVHGISDTANLVATTDEGTVTSAMIANGTIVNADINDSAAIAQSKIDGLTADLAAKALDSDLTAHENATTSVHGIANTAELETQTGAQAKADNAQGAAEEYADDAVSTAVAALTKSSVGLGNVDNTSDANKPVSTATQTALDLKADLAGPTFTGTTTTSDLVVDGDFTVNGTNFSASATTITIEDNLVQLAHTNSANTVDLGLVVAYNDGASKHAGIARDVSDDKWKLFKGVTTEPSTTVAFGEGSLDALAVGALEATTVTPSSGVVFSDGTQTKEGVPSRTPIVQKTASYTLSSLTERDSLIEVSSSSGTTITIPTNSAVAYPVGTSIDILQTSTGQVTIAGDNGVTVNATPGLKLRTTWSSATLFKRAENTWVVYGDLTA